MSISCKLSLGLQHADRRDAGSPQRRGKAGKARYIGASSMHASQFAQHWNSKNSTAGRSLSVCRITTSDLSRRRARNAAAVLSGRRAVIPWSPLARGRLTRPWGETPHDWCLMRWGKISIKKAMKIRADRRAVNRRQRRTRCNTSKVALAWLLSKPGIAAPIIGTRGKNSLMSC